MPGAWPRFASAVLVAVCGAARAQEVPGSVEEPVPPAVLVREGNALFGQEAFEEALGKYDRAKRAVPDSAELDFDRGLTQFKLGRLEEAADSLNRAVLSGDRRVEALSKFLLGNVHHLQGVEAGEENPQAAIESLGEAAGYYLDAVDLQPDNDDLRGNIELTQKLIELIRQKQQEQEQEQSEQCDKEGEQQQDQQEQDQQQNQDEQKGQEQQQDQQPGEDQEEAEDAEQQQASEQQEQGESKQEEQQSAPQEQSQEQQQAQSAEQDEEQQEQARRISQEQAERMFQQIRDKERQRRLEKARRERRKAKAVKRDW